VVENRAGGARPALEGVRVVEFSQLIAASLCGLTLADLGADVVKVESPHGDYARKWTREGQESGFFHMLNRGKRGVALDFRTADGRATARRLVASADVVVENLGDAGRVLGFDHADVAAEQPGLVWCSITGFGRGRPERAIDQTLQASMGMIALTGEPDGPPLRVPLPAVDLVTGMYAVQSILTALLTRERTGRGALLDCAMLDAAATLTSAAGVLWMTGYTTPRRTGSQSDLFVPSAVFETADGRHIQVVAIGDAHWAAIARGLGHPEWAADDRFATAAARLAHRELVHGLMAEVLRTGTAGQWAEVIRAAGGFCEPIREIEQVWSDPGLARRGLVTDLAGDGVTMSVPVATLAQTRPSGPQPPAPALGQHTDEVLAELR
jgi:crotonobetainyl-CoA:carnitine CoA-transferase CaiB-like acyl-CoA transferase